MHVLCIGSICVANDFFCLRMVELDNKGFFKFYYLFIYLVIYLFIYLFIYLYIYLFIYLFIYYKGLLI